MPAEGRKMPRKSRLLDQTELTAHQKRFALQVAILNNVAAAGRMCGISERSEHVIIDEVRVLLDEYEKFLSGKARGTTDAYLRTVRHLIEWVAHSPGHEGQFLPQQLTQTVVALYLSHLEQEGLSLPHRAREAGWSLEEVDSYLGCVPKNGVPALQTTVCST